MNGTAGMLSRRVLILARAYRMVARAGSTLSTTETREKILQREWENQVVFRRLYADNDRNWVYRDRKYYDCIVNTYVENTEYKALRHVLKEKANHDNPSAAIDETMGRTDITVGANLVFALLI